MEREDGNPFSQGRDIHPFGVANTRRDACPLVGFFIIKEKGFPLKIREKNETDPFLNSNTSPNQVLRQMPNGRDVN